VEFPWEEGEFDAIGNLVGVACLICTKVDGWKKVIVTKTDNMEKHEGKRICNEDGVLYPGWRLATSISERIVNA
jgi:hypothetical protein